ncbi:hypothetical protein F544_15880 [Bibersteinia trehalosi USDA-ARS-USMARC-190]|uniref:UDP-N-acetylglucosamine kinase n=1 Tax=Bibersteinia trehalosi USDA-ARS-USMARC-190 TaxID=1263832 RepID=W0R7S2_BIBTR|nr:hypothetical protein [Bibersteinia trehalosi]AHG86816.1 hypothetical protein F544_15880 [Bibersteinia trehalosi USDA-ARS-USMARC-190]
MKKLIIIRGHAGSGKSTFAQQKIDAFKKEFPQAEVFHIENDKFLSENGKYHWTPSRFKHAKQQALQALSQTLQTKHNCCLIVLSNVGVNATFLMALMAQAKALGFVVEIYRVQNFFRNQHGVSLTQVLEMYLALQCNPIADEIFVPVIKPMNAYVRQRLLRLILPKNAENIPLVKDSLPN